MVDSVANPVTPDLVSSRRRGDRDRATIGDRTVQHDRQWHRRHDRYRRAGDHGPAGAAAMARVPGHDVLGDALDLPLISAHA